MSLEPCPYCKRADFPSKDARRMHVLRCRRKDESMPTNDKIDKIFERFGKPKYEKMLQEMSGRESQKPKSIPREPKTKSNLGQFWREEMERKIEEYKEGKFESVENCASEYLTILQNEGMDKNIAFRFYDHLTKRLYALNQSQSVALQPQPQPQPKRDLTLDEMASLEAERVNRERGYSQLIERNWACEICGKGNMTRDEAILCEQSHQSVTTTQNEPMTPREQEPETERPRQIQSRPQSDILFRLGNSFIERLTKRKPEEKKQEPEEAYSPVTYLNTVTWKAPEPIPTRTCEVCGKTEVISEFLAGNHGKGICG
jgi:hypothetical protein